MIGASLTVQECSLPRFQNVSQAARSLNVSRRTVQRNAPKGSGLRDKRGLVDVKKLEARLWIGAPIGAPRNAGYPAGVPRRKSGPKGQAAWAARDRERKTFAENAARELLKRRRRKRYPARAGIPFTIQGVILRFRSWQYWVKSSDPFDELNADDLRHLRSLLNEFTTFAAYIESLIRQKEAESVPSSDPPTGPKKRPQ